MFCSPFPMGSKLHSTVGIQSIVAEGRVASSLCWLCPMPVHTCSFGPSAKTIWGASWNAGPSWASLNAMEPPVIRHTTYSSWPSVGLSMLHPSDGAASCFSYNLGFLVQSPLNNEVPIMRGELLSLIKLKGLSPMPTEVLWYFSSPLHRLETFLWGALFLWTGEIPGSHSSASLSSWIFLFKGSPLSSPQLQT